MKNIFLDTRALDETARRKFNLTEDSMMECAGQALVQEVYSVTDGTVARVLILCGGGNNGGDGYVLARLLSSTDITVTVCVCVEPKSAMCQKQRSQVSQKKVQFCSINEVIDSPLDADVIVDCIFGSGFHGLLPAQIASLVDLVNASNAKKIACDVPSGIDMYGNTQAAFVADVTVTMGALKFCLMSDCAKDIVGTIKVADLGICREQFESSGGAMPVAYLLERSDMMLPHRIKRNVNKGSFGHAVVVVGQKIGAGVIAGSSAFRFGAGLVTLLSAQGSLVPGKEIVLDEDGQLPDVRTSNNSAIIPYDLMCADVFPVNTTAVALGMGLGRPMQTEEPVEPYFAYLLQHAEIPCVLDADVFYSKKLQPFLKARCTTTNANVVLTPHPKEFVSLLQLCLPQAYEQFGLSQDGVHKVVDNRLELMKLFCEAYPSVVLLLKGAVVTVGVQNHDDGEVHLYCNPYGTNALAKGGSGDVLAGMICALLAQKYTAVNATVSGSLAHALASVQCRCDYALTPFSLMKEVALL